MPLDPVTGKPVADPAKDAGTGGGDGGNNGGGGDDLQVRIDEAVATETKALRENRDATLAEKREMRKKLDDATGVIEALGGQEGVDRLTKMRESLEKDELGKLLADGKHDEWFEQRTAAMRDEHERRFQTAKTEVDTANQTRDAAVQRLHDTILSVDVAAACIDAKTVETALPDVLNRASQVFSYDPDLDRPVIREGRGESAVIVYGNDGKAPKTVREWLEEQKEVCRHWFGASAGAGASGNTSGGGGNDDGADLKNIHSQAEYLKVRETMGMRSGYGVDIP